MEATVVCARGILDMFGKCSDTEKDKFVTRVLVQMARMSDRLEESCLGKSWLVYVKPMYSCLLQIRGKVLLKHLRQNLKFAQTRHD